MSSTLTRFDLSYFGEYCENFNPEAAYYAVQKLYTVVINELFGYFLVYFLM